jgi:hypothetical protein
MFDSFKSFFLNVIKSYGNLESRSRFFCVCVTKTGPSGTFFALFNSNGHGHYHTHHWRGNRGNELLKIGPIFLAHPVSQQ